MKFPKISAGKGSEIGEFDLADCFFYTAEASYANAYDGITKNDSGTIGLPSNEFFQGQMIVAFYDFRHAIELKMKELATTLKIQYKVSHKLQDLWEKISKHPKIDSKETIITEALLILVEYDLLQDEELFRYDHNKKGSLLRDLPAIRAESFDSLRKAYYELNDAILQLMHESKFGSTAC